MPDEITFKPRTAANRHVEDQATIDALRARVAELEAILRRVDTYFQHTGKVGDLPVSVHALLPRPHACSRRNAAP